MSNKNNLSDKSVEDLTPISQFIQSLIKTRIELGITQTELAKISRIPQSDLSRLERGRSNPTVKFHFPPQISSNILTQGLRVCIN